MDKIKTIVTLICLFTFCTPLASFALEISEISKDGQSFTITKSSGKTETIHIDKDLNVKKIKTENQLQPKTSPALTDREKKYQKIVLETPKKIENVGEILNSNYYSRHYQYNEEREFIKFNLLDGDYIVGNKNGWGDKYFAEYHKNGALMGLVRLNETKKPIAVFEEYRFESEYDREGTLKHVMFIEADELNEHFYQYIYSSKGEVLCKQVDNNIFIAKNARNMFPKITKKYLKKQMKEIEKFGEPGKIDSFVMNGVDFVKEGFALVVCLALFPITFPLVLYISYKFSG